MRAIKTNDYSDLITFYKANPTQFIEDCYDIKLAKYQKILIEKFSRGETPILFGNQKNYYNEYIRLLTLLLFMKDDNNIAIISPDGERLLNREQFIDYIIEFKNNHFIKNKK